jgi:hypothetical protein
MVVALVVMFLVTTIISVVKFSKHKEVVDREFMDYYRRCIATGIKFIFVFNFLFELSYPPPWDGGVYLFNFKDNEVIS